ncbi:MerR family transcriptional regulator [Ulvibacter sp. MAR_2010_11]|uniref:MerR family transcriptional regulator n=1 Tax=Ulvibacter sp. MAR_2010_11 TaxID=1250229 RepID=UPI000C2C4614|nr:MerR family transcriptional regulator [Ulvibacter sp. MAR_2010_11]
MSVKTQFSIKDLENLSSIKAHTIRIWEKRYKLLSPERTSTNIRYYGVESLKRLLNVNLLYKKGHKISKIAELSNAQIQALIEEESETAQELIAIKNFKSAMFDFDAGLFHSTFEMLSENKSFSEIFTEVFLPLLSEIGILWQTGSIDPAHEHFISELIKQKVIVSIETLHKDFRKEHDKTFVLYLPLNEIHEIGLLYCNYEILSAGYKTIYLGNNIPLESLQYVLKHHDNIIFLSYFTVAPHGESLEAYADNFKKTIQAVKPCTLWIMGAQAKGINSTKFPEGVRTFSGISEFVTTLET